jgi:hypothetical protein
MTSRPSFAWGALLCALLCAPGAAASQAFPEALRQKLELPSIAGPGPGCRLCHRDDTGGLKTATQPFARSLMQAGLSAANVPSLTAALDTLETESTDSDRDGVPDVAELQAGEDPNVATGVVAPGGDEVPLPRTGCSLSSPNGACGHPGSLALLALACAARRRRASSR